MKSNDNTINVFVYYCKTRISGVKQNVKYVIMKILLKICEQYSKLECVKRLITILLPLQQYVEKRVKLKTGNATTCELALILNNSLLHSYVNVEHTKEMIIDSYASSRSV